MRMQDFYVIKIQISNIKLADYFNVSTDYLLGRSDELKK